MFAVLSGSVSVESLCGCACLCCALRVCGVSMLFARLVSILCCMRARVHPLLCGRACLCCALWAACLRCALWVYMLRCVGVCVYAVLCVCASLCCAVWARVPTLCSVGAACDCGVLYGSVCLCCVVLVGVSLLCFVDAPLRCAQWVCVYAVLRKCVGLCIAFLVRVSML